ncbi:MAG: hypothetical protein ACRC6X_08200 [Culicoidibacterales bacterium]
MKNNKMKIILGILVGIVLLSGGGYTIYANNMQTKVEQTQATYHAIIVPDSTGYNDIEKGALADINNKKQKAFDTLNSNMLLGLQAEYDQLHQKVQSRIQTEIETKKYADKKAEIEAYMIVEGANETEVGVFNGRKDEVLAMIAARSSFDALEEKINALKQTNVDIEARKHAENVAAEQVAASSNDRSSYSDGYSGGSGGSRGSSNSGNGSGSSGGNSGGGYTAPPTPARPAPQPEVCRQSPDGSQWCTGGDWWH